MTWEAWYTIAVLALVFAALIRDWGPADGVLMGGALLCGLAGIITPEQVFSGFVNQGTLTIAALFIVAAAMRDTGALTGVGDWVFGRSKTEKAGLVRMGIPVSTLSAFFNNTPIVAMLMPVVNDWCKKHRISPSRMLLPLSFVAILGGTCTLIGTSTNLAINGLMIDAARQMPEHAESLRPVELFEVAWVGVPFVVIGIIYMIFIGRHLLPARQDLMQRVEESPREYLADMQIQEGCRLIGQGIEEAGLRHLPGLFLMEISRGDDVISPVRPEEVLRQGDILTFTGVVDTMVDLERISGLVPVADANYEMRADERRGKRLTEAVISPQSPLIGKSIREADFRATYSAAVIAVHRGGERMKGRIGDIVLRGGDTLLLQTGDRFARVHHNDPDFYLVSAVKGSWAVRHERANVALGLMVLLVALMAWPSMPIVYAAFLVAGLMVLTRCISPVAARKSIDWPTIFTIGAAFGLGHALDESGLAGTVATFFVERAGGFDPRVMLFIIYLLTSMFAALVSSKAAAVLMFPISLAVAISLGLDVRPFMMATMFAAASSFATPLGYPTNMMVYGPGGYRFTDFVRVGLPLNAVLLVVGTILIPVIWPF